MVEPPQRVEPVETSPIDCRSRVNHSKRVENWQERRREFRYKSREISALLDAWDPLGVYENSVDAPPPGEYEDLFPTVIVDLSRSYGAVQLADHLRATLNARYAIDGDPRLVAEKIVALWTETTGPWRT